MNHTICQSWRERSKYENGFPVLQVKPDLRGRKQIARRKIARSKSNNDAMNFFFLYIWIVLQSADKYIGW